MKKRQGFTLMEMLIVVAIIAVLVSIMITALTGQLERARETTDIANIRNAYGEVMSLSIIRDETSEYYDSASGTWVVTIDLVQKTSGWQDETIATTVGELVTEVGTPTKGGKAVVAFTLTPVEDNKNVVVTYQPAGN